jgi:hypothetical protein
MMGCLNEGALEAYLDGELPAAKMYKAAAHLTSCAVCRTRMERVGATAARVNALLDSLVVEVPMAATCTVPRLRARAGPAVPGLRWAVAAMLGVLAISAALGVRAIFRRPPVAASTPLAQTRPAVQPSPAIISRSIKAAVKPRSRRLRGPKPLPRPDDFLVFDDADPIQVGMVVRVMLPPSAFGAMQQTSATQAILADLVIGEDGRARAIRLVP